MEDEKLKEEMMKAAMEDFAAKISENDGLVNGIKYKQDLDLEIQIRIDYLNEKYGEENVSKELEKHKDADGNFVVEVTDERLWNLIMSNLDEKNI